jgi:N utilization substance protein A
MFLLRNAEIGAPMRTNYDILEALGQIAREKELDRSLVVETLQAGILSASRKRYGESANLDVRVDERNGTIRLYTTKRVVAQVKEPNTEISLRDAQLARPEATLGDDVELELPLEGFGRNAIMAAKQVIMQRVREASRERIYEEYSKRVGEIVTGTVEQIDRGDIIVNVEGVEAILPQREQIRREQYRQGDTIRACLCEVRRTPRGPEIIVSRTHPDMVRGLFELEVPEIGQGLVRVEEVAREPGLRTKVAVSSHDGRVDAVGAFVGVKGSRVQAVVKELGGERLDIVPYNADSAVYVRKALSPAKVLNVCVDEEQKKLLVVVPRDQLSLAIGKSGQNVRLAAKLTGWSVDLMTDEEYGSVKRAPEAALREVAVLRGVGERLSQRLVASGFETVKDVAEAAVEELTDVPGIGQTRAALLQRQARRVTLAGARDELAAPGAVGPAE